MCHPNRFDTYYCYRLAVVVIVVALWFLLVDNLVLEVEGLTWVGPIMIWNDIFCCTIWPQCIFDNWQADEKKPPLLCIGGLKTRFWQGFNLIRCFAIPTSLFRLFFRKHVTEYITGKCGSKLSFWGQKKKPIVCHLKPFSNQSVHIPIVKAHSGHYIVLHGHSRHSETIVWGLYYCPLLWLNSLWFLILSITESLWKQKLTAVAIKTALRPLTLSLILKLGAHVEDLGLRGYCVFRRPYFPCPCWFQKVAEKKSAKSSASGKQSSLMSFFQKKWFHLVTADILSHFALWFNIDIKLLRNVLNACY